MLMGKKVSGQCDGTENKQDTGGVCIYVGNNSKLMMTIFVYFTQSKFSTEQGIYNVCHSTTNTNSPNQTQLVPNTHGSVPFQQMCAMKDDDCSRYHNFFCHQL